MEEREETIGYPSKGNAKKQGRDAAVQERHELEGEKGEGEKAEREREGGRDGEALKNENKRTTLGKFSVTRPVRLCLERKNT